jgi:hypothetical protein
MEKPFPRAGAFAVVGNKVGVIFQYPQLVVPQGGKIETLDWEHAEFHEMDSNGETRDDGKHRNVPVAKLRIAPLSAIPKSRRPTATQAKKFGYQ